MVEKPEDLDVHSQGEGLMRIRSLAAGVMTSLFVFSAGCAEAQTVQVEIAVENGSERENRTRESLLALIGQFDVDRWISTPTIRIDENDTPHSHPVLTLHSRHLGDDMRLLAVFLHEQFHWWVIEDLRWEHKDLAVGEFQRMFTDVPSRADGGANNAESTYLHMVVCDLEFQAMTVLLGEEAARELMARTTPYPWIYQQLLTDSRIRQVNEKHGLIVPGA